MSQSFEGADLGAQLAKCKMFTQEAAKALAEPMLLLQSMEKLCSLRPG